MSVHLHPATAALFAVRPQLDPAAAWLAAVETRLVSGRLAAVELLLGQHWPCHVVQAWGGSPNLSNSKRLYSGLWYDLHETAFGIWWVSVVGLGWFLARPAECSTSFSVC